LQSRLDSDADISSRAGRSISMNEFDEGEAILARLSDLPLQPLQRFIYRWPIRL
jgi:hypothetical protein